MPPTVMVLGPSRWRSPPHPTFQGTPLDVRRRIARRIRESGPSAVLMESFDDRDGEDNFDLFLRVIRDEDVRTFVLFWPLGARLHGLDVEVGYLLTRLDDGDLDASNVYLLAEKRILDIDPKRAVVAWSEPGNRTRYHEDLVARGCRVRRWSTADQLDLHSQAIALEHRSRFR